MLKSSLVFLAIAVVCLFFADLAISTIDPWHELQLAMKGVITPDFSSFPVYWRALVNTVVFAFCGTFLGAVGGTLLTFVFRYRVVRLLCASVRAVHELFWTFLLLPLLGLNSVCGVIAIAIPYAGIFAKVYSEILEEADQSCLKGFPHALRDCNIFFTGSGPSFPRM